MANLYVAEFGGFAHSSGGITGVPKVPPLAVQTVAFTATAGVSAAFGSNTKLVRVWPDADAFVKFGAAPTAVTEVDIPVESKKPFWARVEPGDKVSAVI